MARLQEGTSLRTKDEFGQDSVTVEIVILKTWAFKIRKGFDSRVESHRLAEQIASYVPESEWKEA